MTVTATTHLEVQVLLDEDHMAHVMSDVSRGWLDAQDVQEEADNIAMGVWTPYGVTACRVCDCCGSVVDQYVAALWGCVVETPNLVGRYATPAEIPDDYIREVAGEVLAEAESEVVDQ